MDKTDKRYDVYVKVLEEELVPAMGCTEPIALAYAAAKARDVLGGIPDKISLKVSGSIIKNVKSVVVPNTGKLKGIPASVAAGIVAGNADRELEVLSDITESEILLIQEYMEKVPCSVEHIELGHVFDIMINVQKDSNTVNLRIADNHTNIVHIDKNGETILHVDLEEKSEHETDRQLMSMEGIWDFINTCDINDVKALLDRQIRFNTAIAEEGLIGDWGSNIGSILLSVYGHDVATRAKAKAAAGSDARMNGCELPVVINSGSGNQGITVSIPVIEYAKELNSCRDKLYRALLLSNLVSIHCKNGIGSLSAFCGAVTAGAGAGAGIAYLHGGNYDAIAHTVINTLATVSGIVCDGAKASCAAKIASAVDAAILSYNMYTRGQSFKVGDGIILDDIEETIQGIGILGRDGMRETNNEIIKIMFGLKK